MRLQGAVFDGTEALLGTAGVPLPGVKEFLSLMKIEDVWMYLICDGAAAPVRTALEQSGLWNYFRGLLSAEEQGRAPLDPELYEKAVRRLRTARRATVLFTAREAALRAAKAAGFQVVLVGPGHPAEASALADVTVSDSRDMIRVER